jgi:RNA polymerase sigma-32 factor
VYNWSLVKLGTTAAQRKLFFNLRRLKRRLKAIDDGDLWPEQVAEIAHVLNVPERDVVTMNRRLAAPDYCLSAPGVDSPGEARDWLVDESESHETSIADREELAARRALLTGALGKLDERERQIFTERRLKDNPRTLEWLSRQYGISPERVRQIELGAFKKMQKAMKGQVTERGFAGPSLDYTESSDLAGAFHPGGGRNIPDRRSEFDPEERIVAFLEVG